ncbi:uncharacterized protein MYCFIDRAFT_183964 [Pseudocercospora fijiensis CIRAD86]|uniref:Uncharacterized protein n=1 Tax=Pseudocercospora fijiensis (strain CIRAD86) TaxID=383855 RepID=M3AML5_PSEFD|nr:uncharacterized protein MYCFIDRAFT_183964 [Pseudocercospora fijiensis CIRAD86]EME78692.1 hypothetical protein MYCFIDRAFT_183964 [Pseudocercospora fijiensis CIRAD86]
MKPPEDIPYFPTDKRKDSRTSDTIPIWREPQLPESPTRTLNLSPRHDSAPPPRENYFVKPWHEKASLRPYERIWLSEASVQDYE